MPRGGKNHAQGGGEIFARALRAQDNIFLPPWPILVVRPCTRLILKSRRVHTCTRTHTHTHTHSCAHTQGGPRCLYNVALSEFRSLVDEKKTTDLKEASYMYRCITITLWLCSFCRFEFACSQILARIEALIPDSERMDALFPISLPNRFLTRKICYPYI